MLLFLWKELGDSNFQIFSENCQFHYRRLESEHFYVKIYIYIILSTTVSFLELKDTILFLQGIFLYI